jgi:Peptidase family M23
MELFRCARHWRAPIVIVLTVVAVGATARPAHAAEAADGGWLRPVDGPVVAPFEQPSSVYGPGHRGVDFAVPAGTPVRAASDGVVSFAGSVAGTLHVTVAHAGDLRTSYSFLSSVLVRGGQQVARGDVIGLSGGAGTDHDGSVLHLGLRLGDRYVDPTLLFRPSDLTKLVRLVPAGDPDETPWSPAAERRELQSSLRLPSPAGAARGGAGDDGDDCGDGIPLLGDAIDTVCDIGGWLGDGVAASVDAGIDHLDSVTDLADHALDDLRAGVQETVDAMQELSREAASALARTPAGQVALDVVAVGRRFVATATADCSDDAPAADGTGGSTHRVMVVAGINSEGAAGDRGPTVALDVAALGYRVDDDEVRYFSYAADAGPYEAAATHGPIEVAATHLRDQLRAMQSERPGQEVDLIAHSQGGVVADWFLGHLYDPADPTLPPLGNVVTLSSPHEGAPLATAGQQIRSTKGGRTLLDLAEGVSSLPPPSSPAVRELAEGSPLIDHLWDHGVPEHFAFTTIGATEDLVVPATQISVPGATETVVAVDDLNEHSAIVRAPDALRAVRAALEGRAPPCVGLVTALRSAVAPVVISRIEHTIGSGAAAALGASG